MAFDFTYQPPVQCGKRVLCIYFCLHYVFANLKQATTWAISQGTMFESAMKTSCEMIGSCWNKEQTHVDMFIVGLAASIAGWCIIPVGHSYIVIILSHMD